MNISSTGRKRAIVIGAGFAGLSGASILARNGWDVTVLEKNDSVGGRARLWKHNGYTFDMGPSWYLMPEVFDRFFESVGEQREDYYQLERLDPAYRVYFEGETALNIPSDRHSLRQLFAKLEPGGDVLLDQYLTGAKYKYDTAMKDFLYRDYRRVSDFLDRRLMTEGLRLHVFQKLDAYVKRYFKDHRSQKIMEYAMVFLGSSPRNTPALYSLMSHVDLNLGVWFPKGGMGAAALGFAALAEKLGVRIETGQDVTRIISRNGRAAGVETVQTENGAPSSGEAHFREADVILNTGDYHWAENRLTEPRDRSYSRRYWKKRTVAPSMFLCFLGVNRKIPDLAHHNLYFSRHWNRHFKTIFKKPAWPENPCWYMSRISATQSDMAPEGRENLFLLIPVAPGLDDQNREQYFEYAVAHVQNTAGIELSEGIEVKRIFSHRDFSSDYHSFQGSALGLSHTLFQTAVFRPSQISRKLPNLYHAGQYTHPGVGVPMVIISAELAAAEIGKAA